jgi:hypothetical protein
LDAPGLAEAIRPIVVVASDANFGGAPAVPAVPLRDLRVPGGVAGAVALQAAAGGDCAAYRPVRRPRPLSAARLARATEGCGSRRKEMIMGHGKGSSGDEGASGVGEAASQQVMNYCRQHREEVWGLKSWQHAKLTCHLHLSSFPG